MNEVIMRRSNVLLLSAAVLAGSCLSLEAANRFYIQNKTVGTGSTGNNVPVLADMDQDTYGYSISLQYDAAKLAVAAVEPGGAATPLVPEFSDGTITTSPGRVFFGVVFDLSNPITKKLSPGTGREVLKLTIDVKATAASTTVLDLVNIPGDLPRLNVMTNSNGDSVSPAPTLVDGTLTISAGLPVIQLIRNNSGEAGTEFVVEGLNFDTGGLSATLCDKNVAVNLQPDKTLLITAPYCLIVNEWSELTICTSVGCDSDPNGFFYEGTVVDPPFIRGNANNDGAVDISDGVGILNDLFLGMPAAAPCRDAMDSNDSGAVDISDAVYLLNFLFQGGERIPAPYPGAGTDPTADALPPCKA
jgi:hypothetical protein